MAGVGWWIRISSVTPFDGSQRCNSLSSELAFALAVLNGVAIDGAPYCER